MLLSPLIDRKDNRENQGSAGDGCGCAIRREKKSKVTGQLLVLVAHWLPSFPQGQQEESTLDNFLCASRGMKIFILLKKRFQLYIL